MQDRRSTRLPVVLVALLALPLLYVGSYLAVSTYRPPRTQPWGEMLAERLFPNRSVARLYKPAIKVEERLRGERLVVVVAEDE
jgi:hypothetical protein